jgi:thiaminase/transcriptional activator TenA
MHRRRFLAAAGAAGVWATSGRLERLSRLAAAEPPFSRQLWDANRDVYEAILRHPFLTELTAGTLAREAFAFYMMQDAHYLRGFGEALRAAAAKAPKPAWARLLEQHAAESLAEELRLHQSVFREYGISEADAAAREPAPEAFGYISFLLATTATRPFAEGMAAVLPCYWIYWEVGKTLVRQGSKDPVYQRWIANYASPEYGASVEAVIAIVDELAASASDEERQRMHDHFRRSSRFEWMFWDSAYHRRTWPPA